MMSTFWPSDEEMRRRQRLENMAASMTTMAMTTMAVEETRNAVSLHRMRC
ncbi:hypothetical protein ACHAW5_010145 [Stephanodiscus triporus]|uniref:Uncharacterized protein n=1 Tax=Stephanodiscus triporus TaxID=2934178 RepID=A0ABD3NS67_9STRA